MSSHDPAGELDAARKELVMLRAELDETNRGVVALYAELDAQADQLREATELKSRFLAYMSHEFRTPLGSIRSIVRLLLERVDGPLTDEQEKQVLFVQQNATEFSDMVDDLLDLAKVEAGRVEISPAWFEIVDLISALRGMFKPVLTNPDVHLVFEEPQDVPRLYTDDRKLSQILRNFISNALKFTERGEVRVSAALEPNGDRITFSVTEMPFAIPSSTLSVLTIAKIVFFFSFLCARNRRCPVRISYLPGLSAGVTTIGSSKPITRMLSASSSIPSPTFVLT